jgi:opacity protein-like surface antigen
MRTLIATLFCFLLCGARAPAQSSGTAVSNEVPVAAVKGTTPVAPMKVKSPAAPAKGKTIEMGLGYSYMVHGQGQSTRVGMQGADANFTIGFSRLGIKADFGYVRAGNILNTGRHSDVLSYLIGPVFHPVSNRNYDIYIHGLVGGARVTGPIPANGGLILVGGWATSYAWAVGGGVKYWLSDTLAVGTGVDYLRTAYYDPSLTLTGQKNLRATATVTLYFGRRRGKLIRAAK